MVGVGGSSPLAPTSEIPRSPVRRGFFVCDSRMWAWTRTTDPPGRGCRALPVPDPSGSLRSRGIASCDSVESTRAYQRDSEKPRSPGLFRVWRLPAGAAPTALRAHPHPRPFSLREKGEWSVRRSESLLPRPRGIGLCKGGAGTSRLWREAGKPRSGRAARARLRAPCGSRAVRWGGRRRCRGAGPRPSAPRIPPDGGGHR